MPRGSRALQYLPYDYDDEEKELAAADLEDAHLQNLCFEVLSTGSK